jgi:hypothetical protein
MPEGEKTPWWSSCAVWWYLVRFVAPVFNPSKRPTSGGMQAKELVELGERLQDGAVGQVLLADLEEVSPLFQCVER